MTGAIAVTGGNGRLGRCVLARLNDAGHRTVNLSRSKRSENRSDDYLTTDPVNAGEVYGSLARADADSIVHLGMLPTPETAPGFRTVESKAMSCYYVLEAAGELWIDTVVLASSLSVMGAATNLRRSPSTTCPSTKRIVSHRRLPMGSANRRSRSSPTDSLADPPTGRERSPSSDSRGSSTTTALARRS
ncbi:NAD-dependent epimerase/dehydratase family protein [Natrinema halophilum]|uniref:NAD-dependent epimerase/dehydratase family protein n=1 Tax=Natrinema halophilum TaxID=1699371 RepID=UPI001C5309F6|nr:NAD-dependent epimerase/dehydratase family protein [Natrinema halophilum]UHQ96060.1 NAD-dependent epimerase/dehydratase family protein [Natrinema halophilum]